MGHGFIPCSPLHPPTEPLELALLLSGTAVALAIGAQHAWDRFHPRGMYQRGIGLATESLAIARAGLGLADATAEAVTKTSKAIDLSPLTALGERLEKFDLSPLMALGERLDKLVVIFESAMGGGAPPVPPEASGALGADVKNARLQQRQVMQMVGTDLLGVWGGILEQFLPSVHAYLVEHPDQLVSVLQMPMVQKLLGQAQQFVGQVTGKGGEGSATTNPFLR